MLKMAIENKNKISLEYDGKARTGEPHIWGISGGKEYLLMYQISGGSNSKNPEPWRMLEVAKIKNLKILDEKFQGPRGNGFNTKFTERYALVK
jgi:hypothetical protein